MKRFVLTSLIGMCAVSLVLAWAAEKSNSVSFPKGYRAWHHVKSMVLQPGHPLYEGFGGIHHVYANDKGKKGLETGSFPDGSVLVFDLFEAPVENNAISQGPRKVLAVMEKDSKRFPETGGWGFEAFAGGDPHKRVVTNAKEQCFICHESQNGKDYVFSTWLP